MIDALVFFLLCVLCLKAQLLFSRALMYITTSVHVPGVALALTSLHVRTQGSTKFA